MINFEKIGKSVVRSLKYIAPDLLDKEPDLLDKEKESLSSKEQEVVDRLTNKETLKEALKIFSSIDKKGAYNKFVAQTTTKQTESAKATTTTISYLYKFGRIAVAASILIAVIAGSYFWYTGQKIFKQENYIAQTRFVQDIEAPNVNKASITLSNGEVLYLDSLHQGELPKQEGVEIVRLDNGELQYKGTTQEIITNTLTNPRGSEIISITLADGTGITLNSGSSITYPLSFSQDKREVKLTGEAYFDVARNKKMPFVVSVRNRAEVTVLGTKFNVKAYEDDNYASVTLLEGSVEVAKSLAGNLGESHILFPGQQASFDNEGVVAISNVDIEEFIAWKDNMFVFNDTELESIMKNLARWYDLEVVFTSNELKSTTFGALISRKSNISTILSLMEMTETVRFEILDKKVIIKRGSFFK